MSALPRSILPSSNLPEEWQVHLPVFEGPLDLLLHLIKIDEVEITDIPVARICDQFHAYLALMEALDLDIAGDYIYMAAYLIHLKSKLLLPRPRGRRGAEEVEEDPREDLVARLLEYRRIKDAAQTLAEVDSMRRGILTRRSDELSRIAQDATAAVELGEVSVFDLLKSLKLVLDRFEREHPDPILLRAETYSVRSQLDRLLRRLHAGRPYDLIDDLRTLSCRAEAIAAFLAVLELAKLNLVRLHQTREGSILLYRTTRDVDRGELEGIES